MNSLGKRCEQKVKDISCIVEQVYKLAYSYNQLTVATDLLNRIAPVTTGQVKTSIKRVTKLGKSIDQLESILNSNIKELKELYNDGCCDYECEEICVECVKKDEPQKNCKEKKAEALKSLQDTSKSKKNNENKIIKSNKHKSTADNVDASSKEDAGKKESTAKTDETEKSENKDTE